MKKNNIIPIASVMVIIIIFSLCYFYNYYSIIIGHDRFYIYGYGLDNMPPSKYPAFILNYTYNRILPYILNMHPADFRASFIGCSLVSLYYFSVVWIFSRCFLFTSKDNNKKNIFSIENIFILPICFILLTVPFFPVEDKDYLYFQGIHEMQVYLDHVGCCLFYFIFFSALINIFVN
ncbi:MAG: hypothetical protein LUH11_02075, partial [Candidatus Gastranaerophilales bacterium]|nr:hypothetical protein [Candidatus Gastranaerophilales bacterium]